MKIPALPSPNLSLSPRLFLMAAISLIAFPDMAFPLRSGFGTLAVTLSLETVNYGKRPMHIFMCDLQLCNNTDA